MVEIAGKYVQDVSSHLLGEAKTKLKESWSRAKGLATGTGGAEAWHQGLMATSTWEAVVTRYDATLGQLQGNDLDEAEVALSKVSCGERGAPTEKHKMSVNLNKLSKKHVKLGCAIVCRVCCASVPTRPWQS